MLIYGLVKRFIFPLFLLLATLNVFLASWSVLHGDLNWISDAARDMYLRQEISEKGIVLIGPRANGNLFHGPLWSYVTYPGFLPGNGNPIVVGWYWIFLSVIFLCFSYLMVKKLFNQNAAMLFVLMISLFLTFHANEMTHHYGAVFTLPFFFYFFIKYQKTYEFRYIFLHFITAAAIVQFEIAIGTPLLALSAVASIYLIIRKRKVKHLLALLIIPLLLSNFFIFDLRHDFLITDNAVRHLGTSNAGTTMIDLVRDRIQTVFTGFEFLRFGPPNGQLYSMIILTVFLFLQIKNNKYKNIYLAFIYFFLGYYALSLFNRYRLISFYIFPITSLVFLIFSSFITSRHKRIFLGIFTVMYILNLIGLLLYVQNLRNNFIGKDQYSWKAIFTAASTAYQGRENEFGYFIYSPDVLGYGPRYAMEYASKVFGKKGFSYVKKPVTYLLIEPAARNNSFTSEINWKINQIHIYKKPVMVKIFASGYKLEKYLLSDDELSVGFDPGVNPNLHYR